MKFPLTLLPLPAPGLTKLILTLLSSHFDSLSNRRSSTASLSGTPYSYMQSVTSWDLDTSSAVISFKVKLGIAARMASSSSVKTNSFSYLMTS